MLGLSKDTLKSIAPIRISEPSNGEADFEAEFELNGRVMSVQYNEGENLDDILRPIIGACQGLPQAMRSTAPADEVAADGHADEGLTDAMFGRYDVFRKKFVELVEATSEDVVEFALSELTGIKRPKYAVFDDVLVLWDGAYPRPTIML